MKKLIYLASCMIILLVSCENEDKKEASGVQDMTITVYNAEDWTVASPQPVCSGAVVTLTSSTLTFTGTTNDEGKAVFEDFTVDIYSIQVTKGDLSNIVDKNISGKGFVGIGIFQNQAEIDNYTDYSGHLIQPNAQPGDLKLYDSNWDYNINDLDRVTITYYIPYEDVNFDLIVNEDDKLNGEYVIKKNIDMDVFIAK